MHFGRSVIFSVARYLHIYQVESYIYGPQIVICPLFSTVKARIVLCNSFWTAKTKEEITFSKSGKCCTLDWSRMDRSVAVRNDYYVHNIDRRPSWRTNVYPLSMVNYRTVVVFSKMLRKATGRVSSHSYKGAKLKIHTCKCHYSGRKLRKNKGNWVLHFWIRGERERID